MGCHSFLQWIFLTQGLNPGLLHCRQILYCPSHQGSLLEKAYKNCPFAVSSLNHLLLTLVRSHRDSFTRICEVVEGAGSGSNHSWLKLDWFLCHPKCRVERAPGQTYVISCKDEILAFRTLPLLICEEPIVIFTTGRGWTFLGAPVLWTWCQAPSIESLPGPCSFSIMCVC